MPVAVWLNGEFVEGDRAIVSAMDSGLQHGVGLFETMVASQGRVFQLMDHLARLQRSARDLRLSVALRINPLAEAVRRTAERAEEPRCRVRLTITGGSSFLRPGVPGATGATGAWGAHAGADPTILIVAQPAAAYPDALYERGATVTLAHAKVSHADPWAGHKTLNYWWRLRELQEAGERGGAEALLFDTTNRLASGMVSNVFLIRDGVLRTPPARGDEAMSVSPGAHADAASEAHSHPPPEVAPDASPPRPVLPGCTRRAALDWAGEIGLGVSIEPLTIEDVLGADEIALTNSGWGALPVVRVESHVVGGGAPGPVTRALRAKWESAVVEQEDA